MRKRPWALVILAVLHFIAPIGNIIFNALLMGRNVWNYLGFALSPEYLAQNWVIIIAPIIAGYAIYACKKWSFFVYLAAITALFVFSYIGYMSKSEIIGIGPVILVYLINVLVVTYFLIPAVRNIYFDPRMRWWEAQPRYSCDFKCQWSGVDVDGGISGRIGNISVNGLFLKSDNLPKDTQKIKISVPFNMGSEVTLIGDTIIHDKVDAVGFGVQFEHTKDTKSTIKSVVADLERKGMRISRLDGRPEDTFTFWVRTLVTTGRGLVPRKEK